MTPLTLVVMAAGLGSRYGGLKQVEPVGPRGESLLDYSVYDARCAGFGRVVFVIRRDMQTAFRPVIRQWEASLDVSCAFQSLDDLPQGPQPPPGRSKPWGTGHALLAARDAVRTPFAAINADDFYGADSYRAVADFLEAPEPPGGPVEYALVSFRLSETLSEHGGVARAVCQASGDQVQAIEEVRALERTPLGVRGQGRQGPVFLRGDEPVSMNLWGFRLSVFAALGEAFAAFLARSGGDLTTEFLIPDFVNGLLGEGRARLRVLRSASRWFGMTYREEQPLVVQRIRERVLAGEYPDPLWGADWAGGCFRRTPQPPPPLRGSESRYAARSVACEGAARAAAAVAAGFEIEGDFLGAERYGSGHINDTFLALFQGGTGNRRYLLQRINPLVFPDPLAVMANVSAVTRHLQGRLRAAGAADPERRSLTLVPTRSGHDFLRDAEGGVWRAWPFIEGTRTHDVAPGPPVAEEAARAFGTFQALLADYAGPRLAETIAGFHDTRRRFEVFRRALDADARSRARAAAPEARALLSREALADALSGLQQRGLLVERLVHNDTKINNVLFDAQTGEGLCVIDLDTVMPGLALHDFGDLVRSGASLAAEDERDLAQVRVHRGLFEALTRGYLSAALGFLTAVERQSLVLGAKVIVFEQALRFLTDHLEGDRYYRIHREGHNLDRARTQIALLRSLEEQEEALGRLVEETAEGLART